MPCLRWRKRAHDIHGVIDLFFAETRIGSEEENVVHDKAAIEQIPYFAMENVEIGRLAEEVAGKEVSGLHKMLAEIIALR